jgi:hypothetical protein
METLNYLKHVIRKAANYTFSRMAFYLTIFNFFMLASWMYDNIVGEFLKGNGFRRGHVALILFHLLYIGFGMHYHGRDKEEGY